MKKVIILVLSVVLVVSCSHKSECLMCGQEKSDTVKITIFEDEESKLDICRDCRLELLSTFTS